MYLIPEPKNLTWKSGTFVIGPFTRIVSSTNYRTIQTAVVSLKKHIKQCTGFNIDISSGSDDIKNSIVLKCLEKNETSEKYSLLITEDLVELTSDSYRGLFWGIQTLQQMITNGGPTLSCCIVIDSPDFQNRGIYHDVTRGKVPTLKTLKLLVDKLASYKINQLQLYIEHTFAFRSIPELWFDKDPLTAEEILELDRFCSDRYVELVPSLATFGHLYELLRVKRFEHLNELDIKASDLNHDLWDRMAHYTLDPQNPESITVVKQMLDEFLPLFSSKYCNICCDETFDLGKGKSSSIAEKGGAGRLYVEFVKKVMGVVDQHGKTPMFWGDIVLHHPELIKELPKNAIFLNWSYDANVTSETTKTFADAGVELYVCPGTTGWSRFSNDINTATENIKRMVKYGRDFKASGVLTTDWGDCGHVNFLANSYHGLVLGAALSWNSESYSVNQEYDKAISFLEWGESGEKIGGILRELGSLNSYHLGNLFAWVNGKEIFWNAEGKVKEASVSTITESYKKASHISYELSALLKSIPCKCRIDIEEFVWSARSTQWILGLLIYKKHIEYKQTDCVLVMDKDELISIGYKLIEDFKLLWRKRNKESELRNVVTILHDALNKIQTLS